MKILLIDDSKTMRRLERGLLSQMGHTDIIEATDGLEAFKVLTTCTPDLLLVDLQMPHMDGLSFVRQYRASGGKAKVIMLSAEAERARVIEAIRAGVNNFVIKPFTPDLLTQRINETMASAPLAA